MDTITKEEAIEWLLGFPDDQELCMHCLHEVATDEEGHKYCTNDMCLYEGEDD
jgi:hypothetical protein